MKLGTASGSIERGADYALAILFKSGVGVEGVLQGGAEHYPLIIGEYVFTAVTVVYIEVEYRDPFQSMRRQGVGGTNSNIIVDTEAHCPIVFGMVSRRPYCTEGVIYLSLHNQIGGIYHGA
jgi:hypothetical protein